MKVFAVVLLCFSVSALAANPCPTTPCASGQTCLNGILCVPGSNPTCNDVASNCAQNSNLCDNGAYFDLMTKQCPKTCGRCPGTCKLFAIE